MKNLTLIFFIVLLTSAVSAQAPATAMDFTADDCDGITHNLFSELEEGAVVLMEFVMLDPCTPCVRAREALQPMFQAFNTSHPGKFRIYTIGWSNTITCSQMQKWMEKHSFINTFFAGNGDLTDYYGGMGMPTIALVAGKDSKVLYVNDVSTGFSLSDTTVLKSLIAEALTPAAVTPEPSNGEILLYPNPAADIIRIAMPGFEVIGKVKILNALGQVVASPYVRTSGEIHVGDLEAGLYTLLLTYQGQERRSTFIKH